METLTLYHFTSAHVLHGIGRHGLTVGDVSTDVRKMRGVIGVWLTSSPEPDGHGLEGSALDKKQYRLTVELPAEMPTLHRWAEWSSRFVKPETRSIINNSASGWESWYIVLGIVKPAAIVACLDTRTGELVPEWQKIMTSKSIEISVPPQRRQAWQKRMIKGVRRELARRS